MLTRRIRKQIEWHFYNHKADLALFNERRQDIMGSCTTVNYSGVGGKGGISISPTEKNAIRLEALDKMFENRKDWFCVVRNTFLHFRHEPEHEIMIYMYTNNISRKQAVKELCWNGDMWETVFDRMRDKWLTVAYKWAVEFGLMREERQW